MHVTTSDRTTGLDFLRRKTPFEIIVALIKDLGDDTASRDRIALASTFSHGEGAWVAETAWHAAQRGLHVKREAAVGGAARVDCEVAGTAVEFKSTFGAWALKPGLAGERDRWLGKDVDKLMAGRSAGVVVVTVAALTMGVSHQRQGFKVMYGDPTHAGLSPVEILEQGVAVIDEVLSPRCAHIERVELPPGVVPPNSGAALLTALVGAVNPQAVRI